MTEAVSFARRGDHYVVAFRYDPRLVAVMKTVPAAFRSWDSNHKQWTVRDPYGERVAADIARLGYLVVGVRTPVTVPGDAASWARALFARVGPKRIDPVFRALTRICHPDNPQTGDTSLQRELNAARQQMEDTP